MTVQEALNMAMDEEIARDERVFLMGEELAQYYTPKLISLSIFLVVKWGQSSPWRSIDSTCALAAVIYYWECVKIKVQLPLKPLDVLGMTEPPLFRAGTVPETVIVRSLLSGG